MVGPVFFVDEVAGHGWAVDFGERFDVDDFFLEEVAEEKHGEGGEDAGADDDVGFFFDEDEE